MYILFPNEMKNEKNSLVNNYKKKKKTILNKIEIVKQFMHSVDKKLLNLTGDISYFQVTT